MKAAGQTIDQSTNKLVESKLQGVILGTVIGDAIGLPREGLSRRRAARMFGNPPLRHRLIFGRGMMSDDGEHTCMTAQALLASRGEAKKFARSLAWRLRGWILALPAGVGKATARSIIKLWLGFPPHRSGVWSAGNGPAMRAAVIGAYAADDPNLMRQLIHASTIMTHRDPAAEDGAMAIAWAASCGFRFGADLTAETYLDELRPALRDSELLPLIEQAATDAVGQMSLDDFLKSRKMERGVSGYINHTVVAAIFCWLRSPGDYRQAVEAIVSAGGDSDTTAAIVGGLVGAAAGIDAIPIEWRRGLLEWPRTQHWMLRLGLALAEQIDSRRTTGAALRLAWIGLPFRNLVFLIIVILHGLRRLFPPY